MDFTKIINCDVTEKPFDQKMVKNNTNGYVFQIDDLKLLRRFLIIGCDGGTFYQNEKEISNTNLENLNKLINNGKEKEILAMAIEIIQKGLSRKIETCLFTIAYLFSKGTIETKNNIIENILIICNISTHLFIFSKYIKQFRGWGNTVKKLYKKWYDNKTTKDLAYQVVKYQGRNTIEGKSNSKWTHRDLLRLNHISTDDQEKNLVYQYVVSENKYFNYQNCQNEDLKIIEGFEKVKNCKNKNEIIKLITDYKLTREMIPTEFLSDKHVQEVIISHIPYIQLVRSLASFTTSGLLDNYNTKFVNEVADIITNTEKIKKSKIHPLQILDALKIYNNGHGFKGSLTWEPVNIIKSALDEAFYKTFDNCEPTNKKIVLALDVSGSMTNSNISGSNIITCREASAVLAMIIMKKEKNYIIKGFSNNYIDIPISENMDLYSVLRIMKKLPFGYTDCSLPFVDAIKKQIYDIDAFCILTDNETNTGSHPFKKLNEYRKLSKNNNVKNIICSMTATPFSIADPSDLNSIDIVGFSAETPLVVNEFIKGKI